MNEILNVIKEIALTIMLVVIVIAMFPFSLTITTKKGDIKITNKEKRGN